MAFRVEQADREFSTIVRELAGWRCQYRFRCSGGFSFADDRGALTCSHFQKRAKRSVRFDLENCDAACVLCHKWVEDTVEGQRALVRFKKSQLGLENYRELVQRSNVPIHQPAVVDLFQVRELRKWLTGLGKLTKK